MSVQTWFSTRILRCFLSLNRFNLSSLKEKQNLLLILIRSGKSCSHISPHVREYGFRNTENVAFENRNVRKFCLWNLKSRALESGIPLKKSHQRFDSGIRNPEFMVWNPESKTVLTWFSYMGRHILKPCRMSHAILVNLCRMSQRNVNHLHNQPFFKLLIHLGMDH